MKVALLILVATVHSIPLTLEFVELRENGFVNDDIEVVDNLETQATQEIEVVSADNINAELQTQLQNSILNSDISAQKAIQPITQAGTSQLNDEDDINYNSETIDVSAESTDEQQNQDLTQQSATLLYSEEDLEQSKFQQQDIVSQQIQDRYAAIDDISLNTDEENPKQVDHEAIQNEERSYDEISQTIDIHNIADMNQDDIQQIFKSDDDYSELQSQEYINTSENEQSQQQNEISNYDGEDQNNNQTPKTKILFDNNDIDISQSNLAESVSVPDQNKGDPDDMLNDNYESSNEEMPCIVLYSQCNYKGQSIKACGDISSLKQFQYEIKSLKIPSGMTLSIYDHPNYSGVRHSFSESQACLDEAVLFVQLNKLKEIKFLGQY